MYFYKFPQLTQNIEESLKILHQQPTIDNLKVLQQLSTKNKLNYSYLNTAMEQIDKQLFNEFFNQTIPNMVVSVIQLLKEPPKINIIMEPQSITLDKNIAFGMICLSFFNLLQQQPFDVSPYFNISSLYCVPEKKKKQIIEKIKGLIYYFILYIRNPIKGNIIIHKVQIPNYDQQFWCNSNKILKQVQFNKKKIEDQDNLQAPIVIFADKQVGGYILGMGAAQEEIILITRPEAIVAVFLTTILMDCQSLYIENCCQYNDYQGYLQTLQLKYCTNKIMNQQPLIFMDAKNFRYTPLQQYEEKGVLRELNKAYCGFQKSNNKNISTGRWGCGIFRGDSQLKCLIQLLAFSECNYGETLLYSTYGDNNYDYSKQIEKVLQKYQNVGELSKRIFERNIQKQVFKVILE